MRFRKGALIVTVIVVLALVVMCSARKVPKKSTKKEEKQLFAQTKETTPANFVRLLLMRLIYGIASQLGLEERLASVFNGAFVPPNADDDYDDFGLGGLFDDY